MNMFARIDENPAMTLQELKILRKQKVTIRRTDGRMHGQRENNIPTTNKVCRGYKNKCVSGNGSENFK